MGLEAASFISGLVSTNPVSADDVDQGDDHIRLLKGVLQGTFPNASKAFYFPDASGKTAAYTLLAADQNKVISADATGGAFAFDLPVAGLQTGYSVTIFKSDASANAVTLTPASGTIDGAATLVLDSQNSAAMIFWTGSTWRALRSNVALAIADILDVAIATAAQYRAATSGQKLLSADVVWAAAEEVAVAYAASIDLDFSAGFDFAIGTLTGNLTLPNTYTNAKPGQRGRIRLVQDGTGGRTLTVGTNFNKGVSENITLSTAPGAIDYLYYDIRSATDIILTGLKKGVS
jgi:hypothetical protein